MGNDLTKGNPLSVILRFTLPLLIGNIFQQLYNMADTIIVGRFVGQNALAAVGSTGTIMFLVLGFSQGLTTGFTVLTSQRYGAGNIKGVKRSVANGIILSLIVVVVITILSVSTMRPVLHLMNTPEEIFEDAYIYISIICLGTITSVFYNLLSAFLRAVGNSKIPLVFLVFAACLNVLLDIIFIVVFHMGTAGAAWATVCAQGISAVLCMFYIVRKVPELTPERHLWYLDRADTAHQMQVGIPMALQFAITASGTMIMQAAINLFGATAVAAYTAAAKIQNLVTQGMLAMGQTMASYAGQNYGKGDVKRLHQGVRAAALAEVVYSIAVALLVLFLLRPMMGLFFSAGTDLTEMMPYATTYIRMCALFFVPLSLIFNFRNTMQGCGYGFLPMMGGVVELLCRLVMAGAAMKTMNFALAAFCDPFAWLGACVFTGIAYLFVIRKVEKTLQTT